MLPFYEKYDVLLTGGLGPAPRLDDQHAKGFLDKWRKPSITNIFFVIGGPAIMVCNGFSKSGLPLGMQIGGRPFDELTVLSVAHAYEQITSWRKKRPQLVAGVKAVSIHHDQASDSAPSANAEQRALAEALAKFAGLDLPEASLLQLCAVAPYARAIAQRIPSHQWQEEMANIFPMQDIPKHLRGPNVYLHPGSDGREEKGKEFPL